MKKNISALVIANACALIFAGSVIAQEPSETIEVWPKPPNMEGMSRGEAQEVMDKWLHCNDLYRAAKRAEREYQACRGNYWAWAAAFMCRNAELDCEFPANNYMNVDNDCPNLYGVSRPQC